MKTLAERHADRRRRKEENAAELNPANLATGSDPVGRAESTVRAAEDAMAGLSEDERNQVMQALRDNPPSASRVEQYENRAGIGVVNPLVVEMAQGGDGAGPGTTVGQTAWGSPPTAEDAATDAPGSAGGGSKPAKPAK